jgi:sec-independent protein translocase protein TatA
VKWPSSPVGRASLTRVGIESPVHLLLLGVVALIVLGPKRLPELARALGKGMREFRESINLGGDDQGSPTERDRRDG